MTLSIVLYAGFLLQIMTGRRPVGQLGILFRTRLMANAMPSFMRLSKLTGLRKISTITPSVPFSGTHHVLRHNVFQGRNLTGQLYLVCKLCWLYVRHISTICEPCGGCEFFDNKGFELDLL